MGLTKKAYNSDEYMVSQAHGMVQLEGMSRTKIKQTLLDRITGDLECLSR